MKDTFPFRFVRSCALTGSVRPGVIDAVLRQLSPASVRAVADAEFEVRIILVAPAALGADPGAALRGRGEALEALATGGHRGLAAQAGEERTAAEEQPVEHGGGDAGADVGGAGDERVEQPGGV